MLVILSTLIYWKEEKREKEKKKTRGEQKEVEENKIPICSYRQVHCIESRFPNKKSTGLVVHTIFSLKMFYQYFCDSQTFLAMLTALCSASQDGGNVNVSHSMGWAWQTPMNKRLCDKSKRMVWGMFSKRKTQQTAGKNHVAVYKTE